MTIASDNAARFANRDRTATADRLLNAGVSEAIRIIRSGHVHDDPWAVHDAAVTLSVAGSKAERVMGP
jgi:hypothetical protein